MLFVGEYILTNCGIPSFFNKNISIVFNYLHLSYQLFLLFSLNYVLYYLSWVREYGPYTAANYICMWFMDDALTASYVRLFHGVITRVTRSYGLALLT